MNIIKKWGAFLVLNDDEEEEIEQEKGVTSRIVYSLPFLSVIDQTEKVIREIFNINEIEMDQSLFHRRNIMFESHSIVPMTLY